MYIQDCIGCKYFVKYHGNKDKLGERTLKQKNPLSKHGTGGLSNDKLEIM